MNRIFASEHFSDTRAVRERPPCEQIFKPSLRLWRRQSDLTDMFVAASSSCGGEGEEVKVCGVFDAFTAP